MLDTDDQKDQRSGSPTQSQRTSLQPAGARSATSAHVRTILFSSATRLRNLGFLGMVGASATIMLGLGMTWSGLGLLGLGTVVYAGLISADAVNEKFLSRLFSIGQQSSQEPATLPFESREEFELEELDPTLRKAYQRVLIRRDQLQQGLKTGPAILEQSLPEGMRICESLLAQAQRLVLRGQHLHSYLECTRLTELRDSASSAELQGDSSKDPAAAQIYRRVVSGRRRHIETHEEVEGLYDRVLAQLMLIESTLAAAIARIVKITAADDEESSLTASLVNEQLELLMKDVKILEQSLDEASQDRHEHSPASGR